MRSDSEWEEVTNRLSDENERLRADNETLRRDWDAGFVAVRDQRDALRAVVAAVRALHRDTRPDAGPHACDVCGEFEWPCETLAILAAAVAPTEPAGGQQ